MERIEYNEFCDSQLNKITQINKETTERTTQYINEDSLIKVGDIIVNKDTNEPWEIVFVTVDCFGFFVYYVTSSYHFLESDLIRWGYKTRNC